MDFRDLLGLSQKYRDISLSNELPDNDERHPSCFLYSLVFRKTIFFEWRLFEWIDGAASPWGIPMRISYSRLSRRANELVRLVQKSIAKKIESKTACIHKNDSTTETGFYFEICIFGYFEAKWQKVYLTIKNGISPAEIAWRATPSTGTPYYCRWENSSSGW